MLTLGIVLEALTGQKFEGLTQVITDASIDSRLVIPGSMFVAIKGEKVDGHDYVPDALNQGAVLALVDRKLECDAFVLNIRDESLAETVDALEVPLLIIVENTVEALQQIARFWRNQLPVRIVGITGSVGKSTTKEVAAEVLGRRFRTFRNPGNLNNEIGLPLSLLRLTEAHERAVLEMGFYVPGEISLLCDIAKPHVGMITNISHVHMERAGSLEAIVQGKGELVEALPSEPEGVAILNYDEPLVREMSERTDAKIFYYGLSSEADLWASEIEGLGLDGIRFVLHYGAEHLHVRVPMLGRHSVHTALRVAALGLVEELSWQDIIEGLQVSQSQLRLVAVQGPGGALIMDDTYNAAPTSVIAGLNLLNELDGRKVAVLGDMLELGDFEERGHRMVGVRAADVVDELVTVGERAKWIAVEAVRSGLSEACVVELENTDKAIEYLHERIGEGDVVLVKGSRGMEMDKIVSALEVVA